MLRNCWLSVVVLFSAIFLSHIASAESWNELPGPVRTLLIQPLEAEWETQLDKFRPSDLSVDTWRTWLRILSLKQRRADLLAGANNGHAYLSERNLSLAPELDEKLLKEKLDTTTGSEWDWYFHSRNIFIADRELPQLDALIRPLLYRTPLPELESEEGQALAAAFREKTNQLGILRREENRLLTRLNEIPILRNRKAARARVAATVEEITSASETLRAVKQQDPFSEQDVRLEEEKIASLYERVVLESMRTRQNAWDRFVAGGWQAYLASVQAIAVVSPLAFFLGWDKSWVELGEFVRFVADPHVIAGAAVNNKPAASLVGAGVMLWLGSHAKAYEDDLNRRMRLGDLSGQHTLLSLAERELFRNDLSERRLTIPYSINHIVKRCALGLSRFALKWPK